MTNSVQPEVGQDGTLIPRRSIDDRFRVWLGDVGGTLLWAAAAVVALYVGHVLYVKHAPHVDNIVLVELGGKPGARALPEQLNGALAADFWFIAGYGTSLMIGSWLAKIIFWTAAARKAAKAAMIGAGVAVIADLLENLFLYLCGRSDQTGGLLRLAATTTSVIKWSLLLPVGVVATLGVALAFGRAISHWNDDVWSQPLRIVPADVNDDAPVSAVAFGRHDHRPGTRWRRGYNVPEDSDDPLSGGAEALEPPKADSVVTAAFLAEVDPDTGTAVFVESVAIEAAPAHSGATEPPSGPQPKYRVGICLSGGGIRSASVALGALQSLNLALRKAKYVVSVSGGGYTAGAFVQALTHRGLSGESGNPHTDLRNVFAPGTAEEDFIRRHSSYISDTPSKLLVSLAIVLRGLVCSIAVLFAPAVVLGWTVGWLYRTVPLTDVSALVSPPAHLKFPPVRMGSLAAVGMLVVVLAGSLWVLDVLLRSLVNDNRLRRFRTWSDPTQTALVRLALAVAVFTVVIPAVIYASTWFLTLGDFHKHKPAGISLGTGAGGVVLTYFTTLAAVGWRNRKTIGKRATAVFGKDAKASPAAAVPRSILQGAMVVITLVLLAVGWLLLFGAVASTRARGNPWVPLAALFVLLVFGVATDGPWLSLHPFYRRRLADALAVRLSIVDGKVNASRYDPNEITYLSTHGSIEPVHGDESAPKFIFAAAANLTGQERTAPGLNAVSYTMSADWIGGPDVGWIRTADLQRISTPLIRRDLTVQAAVAISGAAFSSAMGRASGWYQTLMAVSGARLGCWLPNPDFIRRRHEDAVQRDDARRRWIGPRLPRARRLSYLLREIGNIHPYEERLLQVTDGGHYENLGLVELFRRRCTLIYCIDASGDSPPTATTLAEALRLAHDELGVRVTLNDAKNLEPGSGKPLDPSSTFSDLNARLCTAPVITGTFTYPEECGVPGLTGYLVFAKALLWPEMPYHLLSYAAKNDVFPHDSTGDQWFNEGQFSAYSELGRQIGVLARRMGPAEFNPEGVAQA